MIRTITGIPGGGGSAAITVNTTTITGGTSGRTLYNNAGTVGESAASITLSGNILYVGAVGAEATTAGIKIDYTYGNTAIGASAMPILSQSGGDPNGTDNTAVGQLALTANTTGYFNTAVGHRALEANTTAASNTAVGYYALRANTSTGASNTAIGSGSMELNTTGIQNVAVGASSLGAVITGTRNTAIGWSSLAAVTGSSNTAIGHQSGLGMVDADQNTAIGRASLASCVSGDRNVALGFCAGYYQLGSDKFIVDNQIRDNAAEELTAAILVGDFHDVPASQTLTANVGTLNVQNASGSGTVTLATTNTTLNLFNTGATTVSFAGAALTLAIGSSSCVTNFPGTTSATTSTTGALKVGNGTAATNVGIGGGNINAGGNITCGGTLICNGTTATIGNTGTFRSAGSNSTMAIQGGSAQSGTGNISLLTIGGPASTNTKSAGQTNVCAITPLYTGQSGTASNTDLLINRTETAIGSGTQLLIDAQVGSVSKFSVTNAGNTTVSGTLAVTGITTLANATATPAGGSTAAFTKMGTTAGFGIYYGSGAPTVSAAKGSLYLRSDGSGTGDRMYVNTDGSTTWTAVTTAA